MIRLTVPSIEEDDLEAIREVVASGYLVQGPRVAAFEQAVADFVGTRHAIAVSNGTAALHLALLAIDVRPGDIVLVTSYSYPATANVIELCGAQPIFVDIEPKSFNLDPDCLERTLNHLMANVRTSQRVKAILPVHTFGQMADMPAIMGLAARYTLPVVEDAACALGARLHGRPAGTWGVMGCFSFHPRKAVTTGEGGVITTNDPKVAHHLRALRNHGQDPDAASADFILPGFNYRMTEFQAAFGLTQMTKVDRIITARRRLAESYTGLFADAGVEPPFVAEGSEPVFQSYVLLLPQAVAAERTKLVQRLRDSGIEATIGTWHIPLLTYYRTRYGYRLGDFPATDAVFARSLTIPLYERMSAMEQREVVSIIRRCLE